MSTFKVKRRILIIDLVTTLSAVDLYYIIYIVFGKGWGVRKGGGEFIIILC